MEAEFWLQRWRDGDIGFHQAAPNARLLRFWPRLELEPNAPVFVPFCGKSLDMRWLEAQGHPVLGIDLAEQAVIDYFREGGEVYQLSRGAYMDLDRYAGPRTTLFRGNLLELAASDIRGCRAVYDRGGLVALPPAMRARYVDHLLRIVPIGARMLLLAKEYEQGRVAGPPFAVVEPEIDRLYGERCRITLLALEHSSSTLAKFVDAGVDTVDVSYRIDKLR